MNEFFQNTLLFLKKYMVYAIFITISLGMAIGLFVWSAKTEVMGLDVIHEATVITTESTVTEYVVGEKVITDGVTLKLDDGRIITAENYVVDADFTTAGKKAVTLTYEENGEKYAGKYPVDVLLIRHFDLRSYPAAMIADNGEYNVTGFTLWAELSGAPKTDRFSLTAEHPDWTTTVVIPNDMYTVSVDKPEDSDICTATVSVGSKKVSFKSLSVTSAFDMGKANGVVNVMPLTNNADGGTEQLYLMITQRETNNSDSDGAKGIYVLKTASGYSYYNFSYNIDAGWTSHFTSSNFNEGLTENTPEVKEGNWVYTVEISADRNPTGRALSFTANGDAWRSAFVAV